MEKVLRALQVRPTSPSEWRAVICHLIDCEITRFEIAHHSGFEDSVKWVSVKILGF